MPASEHGMVAAENRVRVASIAIDLPVMEFLNNHAKGEHAYTLPDSDAVLRQADWPEDARVLWAQVDHPTEKDDALRRVIEFLRDVAAYRDRDDTSPFAEAADALIVVCEEAIREPPARHLLVGIESDTFDLVARGDEPAHPFDHQAFLPPSEDMTP